MEAQTGEPDGTNPLSLSRKSAAELQESLTAIFGESSEIAFRDLPDVIQRFEEKRGVKVLDSTEMDMLTAMSTNEVLGANGVTVEELTALLNELMRHASGETPTRLAPPSPRSLRSSASEASVKEAAEYNGEGNLTSPISEAPQTPLTAIKVGTLPRSASDQTGLRMPASPGTPSRIPIPKSATTSSLHDKGRASSPLAHFERTSPLSNTTSPELNRPQSARAAKLKKARRESRDRAASSSREGTPEPTSGPSSPLAHRSSHSRAVSSDFAPQFARRKSSGETLAWSPPSMSGLDAMASPGLDQSSFHAYPVSPPAEVDAPKPLLEESAGSLQSLDMSREGSQILRETMGDNSGSGLDFFRESIASLPVVDGMQAEQLAQLLQNASELTKKVKESEDRCAKLQEDYEAQILDMQTRLDETSSELSAKRKEEKEARLKREQHLSTIRDHEKDIARLEEALRTERIFIADLKRKMETQTDENNSLSEEMQLKEQTLQHVEDELRHQKAEQEQLQREYEVARTRVEQLQADLNAASKVHDELESQREANASLNEELARVRADLEAATTRALPSSASAAAGSEAGSIGRSLSREIQRRLAALEDTESISSGGETEEMVSQNRGLSAESSSISIRGDLMSHVQQRRNKARASGQPNGTNEVSTQTAAPPEAQAAPTERPPPYTPPTGPIAVIFERYVPVGLRPLNKYAPFLYSVIETTAGFVFYSVSLWLLGVLTGVTVFPSRSHDPYWALHSAYHAEALHPAVGGSVWTQRASYWINEIVWRGLDRSRRVPT